jgi:hypothetical protein
MNFTRRVTGGLILLVSVVAIDLFLYCSQVIRSQPPAGYVDRVTAYDRKLEGLRNSLPASGPVSYRIVRRAGRGDWARYGRVFTQYALAPVLVDQLHTHPLTLVDTEEGFRLVEGNRK